MDIYGTGLPILPTSWLAALAASDLRLAIYGMRAVQGTLRFLHLVGVAGFLGALLTIEVRLIGLYPGASLQPARGPLLAVLHGGFGLAIVSGLGLFLYDPIGAGLHSLFLPKLLLIAIGLLHAHGLRRTAPLRELPARRAAALVSALLWVGVIGCATWNQVERPTNLAARHRITSSPLR